MISPPSLPSDSSSSSSSSSTNADDSRDRKARFARALLSRIMASNTPSAAAPPSSLSSSSSSMFFLDSDDESFLESSEKDRQASVAARRAAIRSKVWSDGEAEESHRLEKRGEREGKEKEAKIAQRKAIRSHAYSHTEYWDLRYSRTENGEGGELFDWYVQANDIIPLLKRYHHQCHSALIADSSSSSSSSDYCECRLLNLGCGNSSLCERLIEEGHYSNISNIDISSVVIQQMKKRHQRWSESFSSPVPLSIEWSVMDARSLVYSDNSFRFIIEKGTIDAMLSGECDDQRIKDAEHVVSECYRTLQIGGVLLLFTHGAPSIRLPLILQSSPYWRIEVHQLYYSAEALLIRRIKQLSNQSKSEKPSKQSWATAIHQVKSIIDKRQRMQISDENGGCSIDIGDHSSSEDVCWVYACIKCADGAFIDPSARNPTRALLHPMKTK